MTGTGPADRQQRLAAMRGSLGFPRWVWWVVYTLPLMFLLIGIGSLIEAVLFSAGAGKTRGTVVDVSASRDSDDGTAYTPLIAYTGADGESHTGQTHISSGNYDYARGDEVDILYDPADPEVVRIDSFFSLYGFGLIFAGVGGVFLAMLRFVRRLMFNPDGPMAQRLARAAAEASARQETPDPTLQPTQPRPTGPSQHRDADESDPDRSGAVRRMR